MKITTFNEHGNVLEEHDYGNLAPKCFLEFNPSQPIFTIEEDELNILNSKPKSFEMSILKKQLKAAFEIDYSLFCESSWNKYGNIEEFLSYPMKDYMIKSVDRRLSALFKYYYRFNPSMFYLHASEILLSDYWLEVLLFHALITSRRNRSAEDPHSALLISFLNVLRKCYYALKKNPEIGYYDKRIEERLTTLKPYLYITISQNKRHPEKYINFYNGFFDRLLVSLSVSKFQNRCVHYNLIAMIKQLASRIKGGRYPVFDDLQKYKKGKLYKFYLSNFAQKIQYIVTLYDLEIDSFRIHPYDDAFEEVSKCLKNIYDGHLKANKVKFENQVDYAYHRYCSENGTVKWEKYERYYQDSILPNGIGDNYTKSPECYYNILLSNDSPEKDLDICNKDIIADLFVTLKNNNDKDQYPLFQGIISLNYIKLNIKKEKLGIIGNIVSKAVQQAIRYILPIYEGDSAYVNSLYQNDIKDIIDEFMDMQEIKGLITKVEPRTFKCGFNLKLVFNFIGFLQEKGIITAPVTRIHTDIKKHAEESLSIHDESDQEYLIERWNTKEMLIHKNNLKHKLEDLYTKYKKY